MTVAKARTAKGRADILFSKLVRARAHHQCQSDPCRYADRQYRLECAHIYSRSYSATRVDFDNALCLCAGCHRYYTGRPVDFAELCRVRLGQDRYDQLRIKAVAGAKVDWESEADLLKAMYTQVQDQATVPDASAICGETGDQT